MPAYLKTMGALACKIVTVYKNNPVEFGLPIIIAKVLLQDPINGDVVCIMDGGYLTAVRTGAVSGIATKYLAREEKQQVVGIFGAGVQAKMQLWAVTVARDISHAYVYDISDEMAERFVTEMNKKLELEVIKADKPEMILKADIICTATTSPTPLFPGVKVKEGTHINGIGSHTPEARELDTEVIRRSRVVVDSREACFNEAGDIILPLKEGVIDKSHFYAELGELITGKKQSRTNDREITIFKSVGLGIQDAAAASLVYKRALECGVGFSVDL
jgi:ornithine cyclodeaminase/alanine dehydrogenase